MSGRFARAMLTAGLTTGAALAWGLRRQRVVAMAAVAMLLAAGVVYTQVGKTFMPTMDEDD